MTDRTTPTGQPTPEMNPPHGEPWRPPIKPWRPADADTPGELGEQEEPDG